MRDRRCCKSPWYDRIIIPQLGETSWAVEGKGATNGADTAVLFDLRRPHPFREVRVAEFEAAVLLCFVACGRSVASPSRALSTTLASWASLIARRWNFISPGTCQTERGESSCWCCRQLAYGKFGASGARAFSPPPANRPDLKTRAPTNGMLADAVALDYDRRKRFHWRHFLPRTSPRYVDVAPRSRALLFCLETRTAASVTVGALPFVCFG